MRQTRSAPSFGSGGGIHFRSKLFALPVEQPLGSQTEQLRIVARKMKIPFLFLQSKFWHHTSVGPILLNRHLSDLTEFQSKPSWNRGFTGDSG